MPVPEKNPVRDGFTFKGWSTSLSASDIVSSSDTVTENTTLYAIWEGAETPSEESVQLVFMTHLCKYKNIKKGGVLYD